MDSVSGPPEAVTVTSTGDAGAPDPGPETDGLGGWTVTVLGSDSEGIGGKTVTFPGADLVAVGGWTVTVSGPETEWNGRDAVTVPGPDLNPEGVGGSTVTVFGGGAGRDESFEGRRPLDRADADIVADALEGNGGNTVTVTGPVFDILEVVELVKFDGQAVTVVV